MFRVLAKAKDPFPLTHETPCGIHAEGLVHYEQNWITVLWDIGSLHDADFSQLPLTPVDSPAHLAP